MPRALPFLGALLLVSLGSPAARATHWQVPTEIPTVHGALSVAAAGDTVTIACDSYLEFDLHVPDGIVLRSATGQPDCVTLDAQGQDRVLYIADAGAQTRLEGLTITGGIAHSNPEVGGGAYLVYGAPVLMDCVFVGNEAMEGGGAYLDHCDAHLLRCRFESNVCSRYGDGMGGGLYGLFASPWIEDCGFVGNEAGFMGGGLQFEGAGAPQVVDCRFEGNLGQGGAALWLDASASFARCSFVANHGSALYLSRATAVTLDGCLFLNNQSGGSSGGGVYASRTPSVVVVGTTFHGNQADYGSAVYLYESHAALDAVLMTGGTSAPVYCNSLGEGATATASCSDIWGNLGSDWSGCLAGQQGGNGNLNLDPGYCDAAAGDLTLSADSPCLPANNSCGVQIGVFGEGCAPRGMGSPSAPLTALTLEQNHPNPFNPSTRIDYHLPNAGPVRLRVFDLAGRHVRTLLDGWREAGPQTEHWEGRDESGRTVASGIYLLRLEHAEDTRVRRMVLLR